jgi:broad specificity phosphatase PhoE
LTRIYLLRHAQAQEPQRYHGRRSDPDLTGIGEAQAQALGKRLAGFKLDFIYTSPLARARRTAAAVAQYQECTVEVVKDLAEIDFGRWEGLTYQDITLQDPQAYSSWIDDPTHFTPPAGESIDSFFQRVREAFEWIRVDHRQGDIAVVSHGGAIRAVVCSYLGLGTAGFWTFKVELASISLLEFDETGRCVLERLNDTCHLEGIDLTGEAE